MRCRLSGERSCRRRNQPRGARRSVAFRRGDERSGVAAVYDHDAMRRLGELLLDTDGPYWDFYPRESVERLVSATR